MHMHTSSSLVATFVHVKELQRRVEKDESDDTTVDLARGMFDTAIITSGYTLPDSSYFAAGHI